MSTMDRPHVLPEQLLDKSTAFLPSTLRREFLRKSIHLLVGFVPSLAALDLNLTVAILAAGTLLYVFAEQARQHGSAVFLISEVTELASRDRDRGRFVLSPVTLGVGALLSLMLYPQPASAVAIYALAFGDGLASLAGKLFGSIRIPLSGGKTLQGSLTCFTAVLLSTVGITRSFAPAVTIAGAATLLELLPTRDFDNIVLPVGTGLVAMLILPAAGPAFFQR
jgi:phytol kinase